MLKQLQKAKDQKGFTIIEVLIVLAIAGLIMVVVFLAVPNLQRSQRNNARKTDANNMLQNLSEYVGNASGALPTTNCTSLSACDWISYKPQQLTTVSYYKSTTGAPTSFSDTTGSSAALIAQATCNGITWQAGGARDYAIFYQVEGSTKTSCIQGS